MEKRAGSRALTRTGVDVFSREMVRIGDAWCPVALAVAIVGALAAPASAACTAAGSADAVACEINRERVSRGLRALVPDARLERAGRAHARDMVRRGYFSHVSLDGAHLSDRLRDAGYVDDRAWWRVGETLAWGRGALASPAAAVRAWLRSPPHRRVLLRPDYRDVGVGALTGLPFGGDGMTYASEFGVRGG